MKLDEALSLLEAPQQKDPALNKRIEKTLVRMERFIGQVSQDQNRGDLEQETFFDGYLSAAEVWLELLAKEFPGLRKKIK